MEYTSIYYIKKQNVLYLAMYGLRSYWSSSVHACRSATSACDPVPAHRTSHNRSFSELRFSDFASAESFSKSLRLGVWDAPHNQ